LRASSNIHIRIPQNTLNETKGKSRVDGGGESKPWRSRQQMREKTRNHQKESNFEVLRAVLKGIFAALGERSDKVDYGLL